MPSTQQNDPDHFCLAVWCNARRSWQTLPGQYERPGDAENAATDRGIYRVYYVTDGRLIRLDTFARVADDE